MFNTNIKASQFNNPVDTSKIKKDTVDLSLLGGDVFRKNQDPTGNTTRVIMKKDSLYYLWLVDNINKRKFRVLTEPFSEAIIDYALFNYNDIVKFIILVGNDSLIGSPYRMVYFRPDNGSYNPIIIYDSLGNDIFVKNKPKMIHLYTPYKYIIYCDNNIKFLLSIDCIDNPVCDGSVSFEKSPQVLFTVAEITDLYYKKKD